MFSRSIVLVLAFSTILTSRFVESPADAIVTPQFATTNAVLDHGPAIATGSEIERETVVVSIPMPVVNEVSAAPASSMLKPDHSMLLETSSTEPVNMHSTSATIYDGRIVDIEPSPTLAAPETNTVVTHPIDNAGPVYTSPPVYHASPVNHVAPVNHVGPVHHENQYATEQAVLEHHDVVQQPVHYAAPAAVYRSNHVVHQPTVASVHAPAYASTHPTPVASHPALNTQNYNLFQYRRMMLNHSAPQPHELQGTWRGINKGVATVAIDERFIKDFRNVNGQIYGDNIEVQKNAGNWTPIQDDKTGGVKRQGKFLVQQPGGIGPFGHGIVLNYSKGGNRKLDPANLISDQLVKLDENHMLGRATAKFGPIRIPLAYFVLQRVPE